MGRILAREGKEIIVDPARGGEEREVRLLLLGSAIGAILQQRGYLTLHSSAILSNRGAVLFLGPSGAGKSSMAAAFMKRGYHILTDDISSVALVNRDQIRLYPGFPQLKLWPDAVNALGIADRDLRPIMNGVTKLALPVRENFQSQPHHIYQIIVLTAKGARYAIFDSLSQLEKLRVLRAHTYRHEFLQDKAEMQKHIDLCGSLAVNVDMTLFSRGTDPLTPDCTAEKVIDFLHISPKSA